MADLDAIIDCRSDFSVLKRVADETGLSLLVDAGITNLDRAQRLFESGVSKLIIGTETLDSKKFVAQAIERFGSSRVVVSLDMKGNSVIVKAGFEGCIEPMCLLKEFQAMGVSQVIVLDLARVGSGEGVDLAFLKKIKDELEHGCLRWRRRSRHRRFG